jgi:hypothetical protein
LFSLSNFRLLKGLFLGEDLLKPFRTLVAWLLFMRHYIPGRVLLLSLLLVLDGDNIYPSILSYLDGLIFCLEGLFVLVVLTKTEALFFLLSLKRFILTFLYSLICSLIYLPTSFLSSSVIFILISSKLYCYISPVQTELNPVNSSYRMQFPP